ncbi:MAG: GIY-YIG nuclease family protein [Bacteroidia bacterium]|nr:GIY-YIG nuclease family protein [Bacteroidia bacterium]
MNLLSVYILKCNDNSYYTGVTNDIERRLFEHENGINTSCYTFSRRPLKLVWLSESMDATQAIELEKQIKGWRKSKKEALITGNWDELIKLAAIRKGNIK